MAMLLNALGVIALGAMGWFTLEFVGRPVRGFFDLRRQVRTHMLRLNRLGMGHDINPSLSADLLTAEINKTKEALLNLADELEAFGQSEWVAAYFVRKRHGKIVEQFDNPAELSTVLSGVLFRKCAILNRFPEPFGIVANCCF
jgi:hypothetical protein